MTMRFLPLIFLAFYTTQLMSQAEFANRQDLLAERDMHSAVPVGIADMNGDGLDDIVTLNFGSDLVIQYQTPDPTRPFVRYKLPLFIDNAEQNDICIADFNNDGANDIMTVGSYDRVKVLYANPHTYSFTLTHIVVTPFFSQGASAGDFNHDGWVDVVMLNDNGLNYTLMNDGTGTLVKEDYFDFVTVPASDNSGNYGSVYTDFDMDGDLDFYIAKCRQGVNNPNDPRRINALFVNDGNGNYTEDALAYGLASGRQTWTADFGDFDNDGDLDCFMTQHDVDSELFENINNDTFINITPSSGLEIGGIPLQGMFRDFDNDGFQDILVSGDRVDYYHNNGDKTFTKTEPFDGRIFGTFAMGDLNHDGFTDVYASTVIPFNNPDASAEDFLFLNSKNDNHFLGLNLMDTEGNPSAIGAMALLYGPWGIQVREVRGGEQYGVSSGHSIIFGLGQQTAYDSLVIRWPDGTREHYNQLEVDNTWSVTRGGCWNVPVPLLDPLEVLCDDDSLTLRLDTALSLIEWSDGSTADSMAITEVGIYYATLLSDDGCILHTTPMEVSIDPDTVKPIIFYEGTSVLCNGELASLALPSGFSYQWSSGETTQVIEVNKTGEYYALVEGYCKIQESDTIHLEFMIAETPVTTPDTVLLGETAILTATGDNIEWYRDPTGLFFLGSGNSVQLDNLMDTVTVYARNSIFIEGEDFQLGPTNHQGLTKYNSNFVNGGLEFLVTDDIILHQITVFTDSVGTRVIEINGDNGFSYAHEVFLEAGETVIDLEFQIPPGEYIMTTSTDQNMLEFGVTNPYLWRTFDVVNYPYEIDEVVSIFSSTFGLDYYYYFYNWQVSTTGDVCYSSFVPATAVLDLGTATEDLQLNEQVFRLTPNPTDGICKLNIKTDGPADVKLIQMDGVILYTQIGRTEKELLLDLTAYPSGLYLVNVVQQGKSFTRKIVRL